MKKKIIAAVFAMVMMSSAQCFAKDYTYYCSDVPADINGPVSSVLSKVTGMNWLISSVLESQVKKQMDDALGADFKVKIEPFGGRTMLQGKFKRIEAHSDSAIVEGMFLSNVNMESACKYNHFIYNKGKVYTAEDFVMNYNATVTSADLQKLVESPQYTKFMRSMNVSFGNLSFMKIYDPRAEIRNNRLYFAVKVSSPLTLGEPRLVSADMGIEVNDGKILFTDVKTSTSLAALRLDSILPVINKLNPLSYKADILNNKNSLVKINDIILSNNNMIVKGLVIVPKNYYNN